MRKKDLELLDITAKDMKAAQTQQASQWGKRWLLFANPKNTQLYWYNRDTKIIVPVQGKYIRNKPQKPGFWNTDGVYGDDSAEQSRQNSKDLIGDATEGQL